MNKKETGQRSGGRKIYTKKEWEGFISKEYQVHLDMMEKELPDLCFFCLYTVTDLGNGQLNVQWEPQIAIKGQHSLHGCPFIVRYLLGLHGNP